MMYLLIIIFSLLPVVNIFSLTIPTVILLLPLLLFKRTIKFNKNFFVYSMISASLIFLISILNIFIINTGTFILQDILYFSIILFNFLVFLVFSNFSNNKEISKALKVFMIVQLTFCLFQRFNILNTNELLESFYYHVQSYTSQKNLDYLEISYRSFGTIGNPVFLSIISFFAGCTVRNIDNKKLFYYLSFAIMLLAGSRMSITIFALIELKDLIFNRNMKKANKFKMFVASIIVLVIAYLTLPFFQNYINSIFTGDILTDYSYTYRLGMVDLLLTSDNWFTGSYLISDLPSYVDSEYILRILQFGIFGLMLFIIPYITLINKKISNLTINIIIFTLVSMLTSIVMTNLLIMQFLMLYLCTNLRKDQTYENSNGNNKH